MNKEFILGKKKLKFRTDHWYTVQKFMTEQGDKSK
jgi:hypothetical protein